ncbi:hypothetical protein QUB80_16620 [Chlorogloeopsis sp. ULAP01]|uniref:hypothetical protein n=1 Tax=Chlorogloeopsis sp. ULAP01 TaxID=3056483 RepID=UPI0025AAAF8A|nr:hypothetical protein [Chlorogloeopsis sp. ULAP01]MDM9382330.1 hypothetical protein [Chlorogloeopsis sp. ULAP01]
MRKKSIVLLSLLSLCLSLNVPKLKAQEPPEETTRQITTSRPDTNNPTQVAVGVYLVDFDDFDEKEEAFTLDAYLLLTWKDKRLVFKPTQNGVNYKTYQIGEIWLPNVKFLNIERERETVYTELKVKPDGTVYYKERFTGRFNDEINLKKFSFDSQRLRLILTAPLYNTKDINFIVDKRTTGKSPNAFLTGWTIGEYNALVGSKKSEFEEVSYPEFIYEINISRYSVPYILNIILPLLFIIAISWTVFWSRSFESNTVIATSSLLSAIAFNIVIAEDLPKVAYVTYLNGFILVVYIFITLVIIYTVVKHRINLETHKELSSKIDRTARWLVPFAFGLTNIVLIGIFLL